MNKAASHRSWWWWINGWWWVIGICLVVAGFPVIGGAILAILALRVAFAVFMLAVTTVAMGLVTSSRDVDGLYETVSVDDPDVELVDR
jgi:hypothetical protein